MSNKDKVKRIGDDFIIPATTNDYLCNSMANVRFTYHQYKLTKLLLTIALFFSVFAFGGCVANYPSTQQQATKTELVASNKYKIHKQAVLYHAIFTPTEFCDSINRSAKNWVAMLFTYQSLTRIRFNAQIKERYSFRPYKRFVLIKKIPQAPDGDILSVSIG